MIRFVEVPLTRPEAVRLMVDLDAPPYIRGEERWLDRNMLFLTGLVALLQPQIVVEVGTFDGETTVSLASVMLDGTTFYGLDLNTEWAEPLIRAWGMADRIHLIRGPSRETIPELPDGVGFAYIDGDHSFDGVRSDAELLWPKMASGGVMAFHDMNGPVLEYVQSRFPEAVRFPWGNGLAIVQKRA